MDTKNKKSLFKRNIKFTKKEQLTVEIRIMLKPEQADLLNKVYEQALQNAGRALPIAEFLVLLLERYSNKEPILYTLYTPPLTTQTLLTTHTFYGH